MKEEKEDPNTNGSGTSVRQIKETQREVAFFPWFGKKRQKTERKTKKEVFLDIGRKVIL